MAIEKNNCKDSRMDLEFSMGNGSEESMSNGDDDALHSPVQMDSEEDDELDDVDSGAGSDGFVLPELGETGSELCQVGDQTCCLPFELYNLPDLRDILCLDVWNECLTEEERFSLTQHLPDMDQETFMHTLKDLFEGTNFHFGSPVTNLFKMFKGGLCEPRVALYRQGLHFFQMHQHYHFLRHHQNSMVSKLLRIKDVWKKCKGYSIDEKLRVLHITRSQNYLIGEAVEYLQTDSSEESMEGSWGERPNGKCSTERAGRSVANRLKSSKRGNQNPNLLKHVGSKASKGKDSFANVHPLSGPRSSLSRPGKASGYDPMAVRDNLEFDDDSNDEVYDNHPSSKKLPATGRSDSVRPGKKLRLGRSDEHIDKSYNNMLVSSDTDFSGYAMKPNINQLSDIKVLTANPSSARTSFDYGKMGKHLESLFDDQLMSQKALSKANHDGFPGRSELFSGKKAKGRAVFTDPSFGYEEWGISGQKSNLREGFYDATLKIGRISQRKMDTSLFHPKKQATPVREKIRKPTVASSRVRRDFSRDNETESDSSDQSNEEEDSNPLMIRKPPFPGGGLENSQSSVPGYGSNNKNIVAKKGKKQSSQVIEELPAKYGIVGDNDNHRLQDTENQSLKSRQKAKRQLLHHVETSSSNILEDNYFSSLDDLNTERSMKTLNKSSKKGKIRAAAVRDLPLPLTKASLTGRRQRHNLRNDLQSKYLHDYYVEEDENLMEDGQFRDSVQNDIANAVDPDSTLIGCHSAAMKRKAKAGSASMDAQEKSGDMDSTSKCLFDESPSARRQARKKADADPGDLVSSVVEEELEPKAPKKFTLITPTVHTDFSFSIVHLLSAIRMAMITSLSDSSFGNTDETSKITQDGNGSHNHMDGDKAGSSGQTDVPSLSIQEIVNRVRLNPGDPNILNTQEPLLDLIRGVLKIFLSKTAPLGAKGWKPLVQYDMSTKSWSWVGPIPEGTNSHEFPDAYAPPEAWGIPHKMLVKLVDSFATWLKSGRETLQQIDSLPAPPLELMQKNLDENERFRDLRAQKSLSTISLSSEEVRAYFQKEEQLRYSIPDRTFFYTAADGKKSIVAALRRGGGKPTSKARDHPILKRDRPPHVTILCLVRDAAARLPGSIGTRADVCTLIRDSQYIMEDASDSQVNQVVSGALDRLHYERDPCVQFDGERKLWVYLHSERDEEDFEGDGTSSTRKWKRQKKDAADQCDQETLAAAHPVNEEQGDFDFCADLNAEPSCADEDRMMEVQYDDTRQNPEDHMDNGKASVRGGINNSHPTMWERIGFNPVQDNKLLCPEKLVNEDLNDDTFAGDTDGDFGC